MNAFSDMTPPQIVEVVDVIRDKLHLARRMYELCPESKEVKESLRGWEQFWENIGKITHK